MALTQLMAELAQLRSRSSLLACFVPSIVEPCRKKTGYPAADVAVARLGSASK